MKKWIILAILTAGIVSTGWAVVRGNQYRDQALRADSLQAAADTARQVAMAALGDSVTAFQRRIVQIELQRDSVDAELQSRPVIRLPARVVVDTLRMVDTVDFEPPSSDTLVRWSGRDGPFSIVGHVALTDRPVRAVVEANVAQVDPINVGVRVTCEDRPGINAASVLLTADPPFALVPGQPEASPEVCNRVPFQPSFWPELSWKGVGYDLGKLVLGAVAWELLQAAFDEPDRYEDPQYIR